MLEKWKTDKFQRKFHLTTPQDEETQGAYNYDGGTNILVNRENIASMT
jgi:hypothetical protein